MTPELETKLRERYPKIFVDGPLLYRLHIGDGWFTLVDTLAEYLQSMTDQHFDPLPQPKAVQVKEKLGGLRFVIHPVGVPEQRGAIKYAEALSLRTCDQCGAPGRLVRPGAVLMTRCEAHSPPGAMPVELSSHRGF